MTIILTTGIICGIAGVFLIKKKQMIKTGMLLLAVMAVCLIYYAVNQYCMTGSRLAFRSDEVIFKGEAYAIASLMKKYFPDAQSAVVLGWGDAERVKKMDAAINKYGCKNAKYVPVFDHQPMDPENSMYKKTGEAYKEFDAVRSAEVVFSSFPFSKQTAEYLGKNQQLVMFDSLPDRNLWKEGVVRLVILRRGNITSDQFPFDPERFFKDIFHVYVNDGKLVFDEYGNFK